jgi:hypothetical protein
LRARGGVGKESGALPKQRGQSFGEYEDSAFQVHQGDIDADHRYSGQGLGAIYSSTSETEIWAEVAHYGVPMDSVAIVSRDIKIDNVSGGLYRFRVIEGKE